MPTVHGYIRWHTDTCKHSPEYTLKSRLYYYIALLLVYWRTWETQPTMTTTVLFWVAHLALLRLLHTDLIITVQIYGFHAATDQMQQERMQVLFEGVLHLEICVMINHFMKEHYFSLDTLNTSIKIFVYGRTESWSKPSMSFSQAHIYGQ